MSSLSPELKERIEENRRKALERRASMRSLKERLHSCTQNTTTSPKTVISANLQLLSKNRFAVGVKYNIKLIEFFKSIPGRHWGSYQEFKEKAELVSDVCEFDSLPPSAFETDITCIDPVLYNKLFEFQKEGVRFGVNKNGKVLIADDMGLGKTLQALGIAHYYVKDWPLLIVCPSSMKFQWREEIYNNLPSVPEVSTVVIKSSTDDFENARIIIMSYDLLTKLKHKINDYKFGVIVLDESHAIKNSASQRTQAALEVVRKIKRVILLSGTPALSRPIELFTQIKAVSPYLFPSRKMFGKLYCNGYRSDYGFNFNGASNLQELKTVLEKSFMIRRTKTDVLDELPPKMRYVVVLNRERVVDNESMRVYAKKLETIDMTPSERRDNLFLYYAETGRAKVPAICEYVEELLEIGEKFLVFGHHRAVLDGISKVLRKKNVEYIRIDGSVSSEQRKLLCDQFQKDERFRVAVLSLKAANTGLTLTAAGLVIFAELFWNPGDLTQAEDRAHRIGQKSTVMVQYLLAKDTADDYMWPLIQSKLHVLSKAGLSNESQLGIENNDDEALFQESFTSFEGYDADGYQHNEHEIEEDNISQTSNSSTNESDTESNSSQTSNFSTISSYSSSSCDDTTNSSPHSYYSSCNESDEESNSGVSNCYQNEETSSQNSSISNNCQNNVNFSVKIKASNVCNNLQDESKSLSDKEGTKNNNKVASDRLNNCFCLYNPLCYGKKIYVSGTENDESDSSQSVDPKTKGKHCENDVEKRGCIEETENEEFEGSQDSDFFVIRKKKVPNDIDCTYNSAIDVVGDTKNDIIEKSNCETAEESEWESSQDIFVKKKKKLIQKRTCLSGIEEIESSQESEIFVLKKRKNIPKIVSTYNSDINKYSKTKNMLDTTQESDDVFIPRKLSAKKLKVKNPFIQRIGNEDTDNEKSEFVDSDCSSLDSFVVDDDYVESSNNSSDGISVTSLSLRGNEEDAPQNLIENEDCESLHDFLTTKDHSSEDIEHSLNSGESVVGSIVEEANIELHRDSSFDKRVVETSNTAIVLNEELESSYHSIIESDENENSILDHSQDSLVSCNQNKVPLNLDLISEKRKRKLLESMYILEKKIHFRDLTVGPRSVVSKRTKRIYNIDESQTSIDDELN